MFVVSLVAKKTVRSLEDQGELLHIVRTQAFSGLTHAVYKSLEWLKIELEIHDPESYALRDIAREQGRSVMFYIGEEIKFQIAASTTLKTAKNALMNADKAYREYLAVAVHAPEQVSLALRISDSYSVCINWFDSVS